MRRIPFSSHLVLAVGLAVTSAVGLASVAGPVLAAPLDLPVWRAGSDIQAPYYRGDVLELRLTPAAARAVLPRGAGATRARPTGRLGLPSLDAVASSVGAIAFEPEFRGELPPAEGDGPDFTAFHLVHLAPEADLARALDAFRALPEVASADPIAVLPVSALPNDSLTFATFWLYKDQAQRTDIRAPEAWEVSTGDTGIVVAILDTGVIPYHPDLGGRAGERGHMWANWVERAGAPGVDDDGNGYVDDVAGWDFVVAGTSAASGEDANNEDNDPNDWAGHGTAIAGIVGAIPGNGIGLAGVAPQVRMMALRMGWLQQGAFPPAGLVDMSYAAAAIRYATRNGAHVMNCSWTSQNLAGLGAAVTAATRAGVVLVNAAGNDGTTNTYLGQREDVIAVSATDSTDLVWDRSVVGPWVDLSAAGVSMTSTMFQRLSQTDSLLGRTPAYRSFLNGTSFSAPQVAGAVALVQGHRKSLGLDLLTPAGALLRMRETTDDIRAKNPIFTNYGTGRLNLFRALADPPRSLAVRALARSVGPAVVLRYNTGHTRVVYAMSDRSVVAYDGVTGDTVWVRVLPAAASGQISAVEAGAPLGAVIVVPAANANVYVLHDDGRPVQGWPAFTQAGMNLQSSAIADVNGDGEPEVVVLGTAVSGSRVFVWRLSSIPLAGFPFDVGVAGVSLPAVGDIDGVPGDEIVFTDGNGSVRAVRRDGSELEGYPIAPLTGARAPVLARLGIPGTAPSVVVVANGQLSAVGANGITRWTQPLAGTPSQDPVLADLDLDGVDEILLATTGPAAIVVRDSSGLDFVARPGWPRNLASAAGNPLVVGPLAAAHGPSVMWFQPSGLIALDDSAQVIAAFPKPGSAGQSPSLADLDADGATEVAAGAALADSNIYTYDAGAGTWDESLAHWPTPRGDYARTASHAAGTPPPLLLDRIRPARVQDLVATATGTTSARVRWTVTGDDSVSGTAQRVVLRRATHPLDETTFNTGIFVPTPPPGAAGSTDSVAVPGLPEGSTWWFALRVLDDAGNPSAVSAADSASLPGQPPGRVTDLRALAVAESSVVLTWTAVGDDGPTGRPLGYLISGSTSPLDSSSVDSAPLELQRPALKDAGVAETTLVVQLTPGRRWRFAVRAVDHAQTRSQISNVIEVVTPVGGALAGKGYLDLAPRPNPASGAVTVDWLGDSGYDGPNFLLVHDATGRLRRRIALGNEPGGSYNWDGRDGDSRLLPAGLYFIRLVSGARHADSRVVFLR